MKYNTLIIGMGAIGGLKEYRYDSPVSENVLTHSHACYAHDKINLVGVMDNDIDKVKRAADKWETTFAKWTEDKPAPGEPVTRIDIVVISTPTNTHLEIVQKVKEELNPKIIILEKPCGIDLAEARAIKAIAGSTPIAVNYIRRYDPAIQAARNDLQNAIIYSATFKYCRGLIRDGSHAVDILNWFFGKCDHFQIVGDSYDDHSKDDPTYSAIGRWERCPVVSIQAVDGRVYNVFELEIMSSDGCHRFVDNFNQVKIRRIEQEKVYGNYSALSESEAVIETELHTDMLRLYDNVIGYIKGTEKLKCTIDDAIAVHEVLNRFEGPIG